MSGEAASAAAAPPAEVEEEVVDRKAGQVYIKGALLGKGGFARCYLFRHAASRHVCAGKCVEKASLKKERSKKKLLSEIKIHRMLMHPNVVRFEHFFEDTLFVYVLMEHCDSQTLMERVRGRKRLPEGEAAWYLSQLLDGVGYLQSRSVIHRDLKLGNVFLSEGGRAVRIGDFGLATKLSHRGERKKTMCGTPNYIAPEVLDSELGHSFEVDVWSLGVILYTMLVGRPPFETKNVKSTYKRIQENRYSFPPQVELSGEVKALVRAILTTDPELRPQIDQIKAHAWLARAGAFAAGAASGSLSLGGGAAAAPSSATAAASAAPAFDGSGSGASSSEGREKENVGARGNRETPATLPARAVEPLPVPDSKKAAGAACAAAAASASVAAAAAAAAAAATATATAAAAQTAKPKATALAVAAASATAAASAASSAAKTTGATQSPRLLPSPASRWSVRCWVDYSSKYGLGYLLNGGIVGVYFNDSTKLVVAPDQLAFQYYERGAAQPSLHSLDEFPEALTKKVTLLKHFRSYLAKQEADAPEQPPPPPVALGEALPCVKKWVRTRHAIFFRLSNRTVQVCFFDDTQLALSAHAKLLTFTDKLGASQTIDVADAKLYPDISKRLSYTKDVLHQLVSSSSPAPPRAAAAIAT